MRRSLPSTATGITCAAIVHEWERCFYLVEGYTPTDEEAARIDPLQHLLEATPAQTMADLIAKARLLTIFERERFTFTSTKPATLAASLLRDLERLAGGAA